MTSLPAPTPRRRWLGEAVLIAGFLALAIWTVVSVRPDASLEAESVTRTFSFGKIFTLLFLTMGPLKVVEPFARLTQGQAQGIKRRLALDATVISAVATFAAAGIGAMALRSWGISVGALQLTAGIILFLVALRQVLGQYLPRTGARSASDAPQDPPQPLPADLAFMPLAFPTIVTPYGMALLVMLVALVSGSVWQLLQMLGITVFVLVLDLLAMLGATRILQTRSLASTLGIVGTVMSVLQVSLGVQASIDALKLLGIT
ncbi:MarC family protein [Pyxidicoccus trucidator]|uniref:MarC family protein n=1 Tax=Pyxidicoccus trucidator TaxID=2709662 RepID=UPI0013DCA4FC|nr:MarC family protein [Pyxidicoccus trucidator]